MRVSLIFALIIVVLAVIFALANPQFMEVNLLVAAVEGSTALVLIVTLVIGVVIGILATLPSNLKSRKRRKAIEKELRMEKELKERRATGPTSPPPPETNEPGRSPGYSS